MQITQVTTGELEKVFLELQPRLYKGDPNYIRPLDKDVLDVFDSSKNKFFREGNAVRWVLQNAKGECIGRIAAYVMNKYKNKGDQQPTGCIGFFDCINDQGAADLLFDTARNWLVQQGMKAMDGPVNFGERDKWWGLLIEGFVPPLYGMNYNFPYYKELFEHYGFRVFYKQNCWWRQLHGQLDEKFYKGHDTIEKRGGFSARMFRKKDLEKFAQDFVKVYNTAWAIHEGNKEMSEQAGLKLFRAMEPVIDERLVWFAYYKDQPIAFYINIPDLNQAFRSFNGKFGWLEKFRFLWFQKRGGFTKFVGIIFGVIPRFHGMGVDYYLIVEAAKIIQFKTNYQETELQWQGDFNPKINNISKNLGFKISRQLATYRYLFDRSQPFDRHPII